MPLCIGKQACARARCKQRCKTWYKGHPILDLCRNSCKDDPDSIMSADDFVCSLDPSIVAQYGVEACRSMAPKNNGDKDEGSNGSLVIVIILGILLLGGGIFYFRRR